MPIVYATHPDRNLTLSVWAGTVSGEEWRAQALALTHDRVFPTRLMLADVRNASLQLLTGRDVGDISRLIGESLAKLPERCAVLVGEGGFEFVEEFQDQFRQAADVAMFSDVVTACRWLGVSSADTEAEIEDLRSSLAANAGERA